MKKVLTYKLICSFNPCYDPIRYLAKDYRASLVDFLEDKRIPPQDRLWVVVRHTLLTDRQIHLYGLACARLAEKNTSDKRVKACNDITERFINGTATRAELASAASAAYSAASAADSAAYCAANAAYSAASAARAELASAAYSAARSAAYSAASAADSAAYSAASAAQEKECLILIRILSKRVSK